MALAPKGHYMNLVSGNGGSSNEPGKLFSVELPQASSSCLIRFFYHINGNSGEFDVTIYLNDVRKAYLWRRETYPSTSRWTEAMVELGN